MASQYALFDDQPQPQDLPDAVVSLASLFDADDGARLFDALYEGCDWKQDTILMYGRELLVPRLTAWFGGPEAAYSYSDIDLEPTEWIEPMLEVKAAVESRLATTFNSALANLYRDGRDSVAWHADDERELGRHPTIASVSFGATRRFDLRHNDDHTLGRSYVLSPGSLLVMSGPTQHHWQHRVAKTSKPVGPRINLTFRNTHRRRPPGAKMKRVPVFS